MLTLDLHYLSNAELVDAVCQRCSEFGPVESVSILQPPDQPGVAFALVGMNNHDHLDLLADTVGDGKVSSLVIIRLEHEKPYIPISLLKHRGHDAHSA